MNLSSARTPNQLRPSNEISKNTGFKRDDPLNTFFKYSLAKRFNGSEKNEIYNLKV